MLTTVAMPPARMAYSSWTISRIGPSNGPPGTANGAPGWASTGSCCHRSSGRLLGSLEAQQSSLGTEMLNMSSTCDVPHVSRYLYILNHTYTCLLYPFMNDLDVAGHIRGLGRRDRTLAALQPRAEPALRAATEAAAAELGHLARALHARPPHRHEGVDV